MHRASKIKLNFNETKITYIYSKTYTNRVMRATSMTKQDKQYSLFFNIQPTILIINTTVRKQLIIN